MNIPDVVIRCATIDEQEVLEGIQRRASLMWDEYRAALLAHPEAIALPIDHIEAGRAFVAERGGKIVGFSVVLPRQDGDAELDGLFVDPAAWRLGIGSKLIAAAVSLAASEGAAALHVIANPRAREFYGACGFTPSGEAQTQFGIGILMMRQTAAGDA